MTLALHVFMGQDGHSTGFHRCSPPSPMRLVAERLHQIIVENSGVEIKPPASGIPASVLLVREEGAPFNTVLTVARTYSMIFDAELLHEECRPLIQRLGILDGIGECPDAITDVGLAGHWGHDLMLTDCEIWRKPPIAD
jgi:hypothetical protein